MASFTDIPEHLLKENMMEPFILWISGLPVEVDVKRELIHKYEKTLGLEIPKEIFRDLTATPEV